MGLRWAPSVHQQAKERWKDAKRTQQRRRLRGLELRGKEMRIRQLIERQVMKSDERIRVERVFKGTLRREISIKKQVQPNPAPSRLFPLRQFPKWILNQLHQLLSQRSKQLLPQLQHQLQKFFQLFQLFQLLHLFQQPHLLRPHDNSCLLFTMSYE